jgi:protein-disulfide isomerase
MNIKNVFAISALALAVGVSAAHAADAHTTAPINKQDVEKIVHDYLVTNPDVLIEASQALQKKQQEMLQAQAKSAISQNATALANGQLTIAGNPKGNVTLIEFFDYQCVHCIKMKPVVNQLISKNPNLRVVFKEFPIFGKESEMASRVAIAAAMQDKYIHVQGALFNGEHQLNEDKIMAIAKKAGLNMNKIKTDMNSPTVTATLEDSRKLAEAIHLMGTPAFIVMSTPNGQFKVGTESAFIPGAASEETLQDLIKKAAMQ